MNWGFVILLALSLSLHSVLLRYNFKPTPKVEKKEQGGGSVKVTILPKPSESTPQVEADLQGQTVKEDDCKDWYYGFGVQHDTLTNTISNVHKGYAAHKAGIKVGDRLIDIVNQYGVSVMSRVHEDPRYEGEVATVLIMRDGQVIDFTMSRERVCTEEG